MGSWIGCLRWNSKSNQDRPVSLASETFCNLGATNPVIFQGATNPVIFQRGIRGLALYRNTIEIPGRGRTTVIIKPAENPEEYKLEVSTLKGPRCSSSTSL